MIFREDVPFGLTKWTLLVPSLVFYIALAYFLRHQRARSLERRFAPAGRDSFCTLTATDSQAILKVLAELEFPQLYSLSMAAAIFRVSYLLLHNFRV